MIADDALLCLVRLEEIGNEFRNGDIDICRNTKVSELPWSVSIHCGEHGYGTGNTLPEAIEDALRDYDEHR